MLEGTVLVTRALPPHVVLTLAFALTPEIHSRQSLPAAPSFWVEMDVKEKRAATQTPCSGNRASYPHASGHPVLTSGAVTLRMPHRRY